MKVWWRALARATTLGSSTLPSNDLGCTPQMVAKSMDAKIPVGIAICMALEYDGGPMDP
jgi:hypothetical protein